MVCLCRYRSFDLAVSLRSAISGAVKVAEAWLNVVQMQRLRFVRLSFWR